VIIVVSRDVMIVGAVMVSWLLDKPVAIRPLLVSKLNTVAQISFAAAVLAAKAFAFPLGMWFTVSLYIVAALTLASAAAYLTQWVRHMDL
jgi:cardiolipin synthase